MLPRKFQMALVFGAVFMNMLGFGIVMPLLPFFSRELGGSSFDMGMLITVWAAATVIMAPRWGTFSDRVGRRPTMALGLLGTALAFLLIGLSDRLWMLYFARTVGGLLSAATIPSAYAYVADITPAHSRSAMMGKMGAMFGLGFMLGPSIGGIMALWSIRLAFMVAAFCAALTAVLIYTLLQEPENRTTSATVNESLFQRFFVAVKKPYASLMWLSLLMSFAGSVMLSVTAYFLIDKFSAGEAQVGLMFTMNAVAGVFTQAVLITAMVRKFGEIKTLRIGMILGLVGFLGFSLFPNLIVVFVLAMVVNIGQSLGRPLTVSLLSRTTDMGQGTTMGLQSSFEALGRVVGPLWAGWIYGLAIEAPFISSAATFFIAVLMVARVQALLAQSEPGTVTAKI